MIEGTAASRSTTKDSGPAAPVVQVLGQEQGNTDRDRYGHGHREQ